MFYFFGRLGRRFWGRRVRRGGRLQCFFFCFFFLLCVLCWRNVESASWAQWQVWNQSVREAKRVKMKRDVKKRGRSSWGIDYEIKGKRVMKSCVLGWPCSLLKGGLATVKIYNWDQMWIKKAVLFVGKKIWLWCLFSALNLTVALKPHCATLHLYLSRLGSIKLFLCSKDIQISSTRLVVSKFGLGLVSEPQGSLQR